MLPHTEPRFKKGKLVTAFLVKRRILAIMLFSIISKQSVLPADTTGFASCILASVSTCANNRGVPIAEV